MTPSFALPRPGSRRETHRSGVISDAMSTQGVDKSVETKSSRPGDVVRLSIFHPSTFRVLLRFLPAGAASAGGWTHRGDAL